MTRVPPFTYLASPYTHPDNYIREQRFKAACLAAATLMRQGRTVYCPIAHSHPIDLHFDEPESSVFWRIQDAPMLWSCTDLVVLTLHGWDESRGVEHEVATSVLRGVPIQYMDEAGRIK
jgi:hypothetical protein